MKRSARIFAAALWLILGPVGFAALWLRSPWLWVINLPDPAWDWLQRRFGVSCCEGMADLELAVGMAMGFVLAVAMLLIAIVIANRLQSRKTAR